MLNRTLIFVTLILALAIYAAPAFASASTINNAYNADVTAAGTAEVEIWGIWGNDKNDDSHFIGFSYGVGDYLEVGGSWRITESGEFRHDPTFDAKFRWDINKHDDLTSAVAIGIDNVSTDEKNNGRKIPYIAYTHDFKDFRAHAGYSFEHHNPGIFVGLDAPVGEATLLWDWMQSNDGHDWISAIGAQVPIEAVMDNLYIETNLTFSSDSDAPDLWLVELEYEL